MKTFFCACGNRLWFDNSRCLRCGHDVGFDPRRWNMVRLPLAQGGLPQVWQGPTAVQAVAELRKCGNFLNENVCNWVLPDDDGHDRCLSCRLTGTIPSLAVPGNRWRWYRMEKAKRRLVFSLIQLGLPIVSQTDDPERGLSFSFLADDPAAEPSFEEGVAPRVLTGHASGTITINIAEADDVSRIKMRTWMGESYRTVLGHMRHESGHYYWERLICGGPWEPRFVSVFGDYRISYEEARKEHYQKSQGPRGAVSGYVTLYASMHPWEDWAETWAHYLMMIATIETAESYGMFHSHGGSGDDSGQVADLASFFPGNWSFDDLLMSWLRLSDGINELGLSMGYDNFLFPFVLDDVVIKKLRLVHEVIAHERNLWDRPLADQPAGHQQV